jgi:glycosyltransferase involved in cell wall biosynthesis
MTDADQKRAHHERARDDRSLAVRVARHRIAVNLLWCVPGEVGGSEEYLERQLSGLGRLATGFRPEVFSPTGYGAAHPAMADRFDLVTAGGDGRRRARRIVTEHTWLARRTRDADLVHHGGGTVPFVGGRPIVLTIHDLQFLRHPEYHTTRKLRYLSTVVPRSARRADVIAVPSEFVRSTVIEAFGVDPRDVVIVRHGVGSDLGAAATDATILRDRYSLGDGPVIIYPAITHPHKGHRFLLDVVARHWIDPDLRLVLLGGRGSADGIVEAAIDELGVRPRVVRPGRVPAADRDGLIALSDALVFPSEYEGFGAPALEAMALGTPVVCADHPALAEVVGSAGLVLPRAIDAWSGALDEVGRRRGELVAAGTARAAHFTLERSGADLALAYDRALEQTRMSR